MSESESDPFDYVTPSDLEPTDTHDYEIDSVCVENDDYPDELAIFDANSEGQLTETWIAATGESFVALADWR
ncbi:DUF7511 domain-containing protein [Natrinema versiforme]|uniref:DUF7511 domain-containing protein n=1 Tax=Natrinema versiforme JCM 10478 TaxID=1227496 RepID=L9Y7G2_9EURY|nr:hypothetical protein [Natrinema versiforme]ELY68878.1 hypothetical protein C489_05913 [Natrinema versiforme JCM 10478]